MVGVAHGIAQWMWVWLCDCVQIVKRPCKELVLCSTCSIWCSNVHYHCVPMVHWLHVCLCVCLFSQSSQSVTSVPVWHDPQQSWNQTAEHLLPQGHSLRWVWGPSGEFSIRCWLLMHSGNIKALRFYASQSLFCFCLFPLYTIIQWKRWSLWFFTIVQVLTLWKMWFI